MAVALALAACGGDSSPAGPTSNAKTIWIVGQLRDQSFSPNPSFVGGQIVVWRNSTNETHRIVANDGSFDTGNIAPGATSGRVQVLPVGLNYYCSTHSTTMFGAIGGTDGTMPPGCTGPYCCCG